MLPTDTPFLLVDDSMAMRQTVINVLNGVGFENIEIASNGKEALEKIKAVANTPRMYKVIFLDWNMPEMDGLEFLKKCRADYAMNDLAVIMLTAVTDQKSVVMALDCGATSYITKPVTPETILKKVEQIGKWFVAQGREA